MKPVQTTQFVNSGNFDGDTVEFGFDQNSLAHLQSILSDLYSNPYLAVLRELSANGLDAQIANGYTGPIEVKLPSALSPTLTIKDYGIGMSLDDLYKTYTKYGASTKRGTDTQVGMLGIGSKSPLAIADSFSITTVHNGLKVAAVVSKNEHGIGQLQIIDTSPSSDLSGTKISIPTDRNYETMAADLFRFWGKGTVVVNGVAPKVLEGYQIDDNILITDQLDRDYIVMGNIPYPVAFNDHENYYDTGLIGNRRHYNRANAVVRVPIGSVNFAPSREELNYSNHTTAFLRQLRVDVKAAVAKYATEQVDALMTHAEVITFIGTWRRFDIGVDLPTKWRGIDIPRTLKVTGDDWSKHGWRKNRRCESLTQVYVERIFGDDPPIFVMGWDRETVTSSIKNRMNLWMEENGEYDSVIFCDTFDDKDGWFANVNKVTVAELKAIKLPKKARVTSTGKPAGSYQVMTSNGWLEEQTTITGDPLYYSKSDELHITGKVTQFGRPVVEIGKNRVAKFLRDFPNAEHVSMFAARKVAAIKWTDEDSIVSANLPRVLSELPYDLIDDPELAQWIAVKHGGATANMTAAAKLQGCGTFIPSPPRIEEPFTKRYPLVDTMYSYSYQNQAAQKVHMVMYLNMIYAATQDQT